MGRIVMVKLGGINCDGDAETMSASWLIARLATLHTNSLLTESSSRRAIHIFIGNRIGEITAGTSTCNCR